MSKGKRYDEPKLNLKKVFAVLIAFIVVIMFVIMIKGILDKDKLQGKIMSKSYFAVFQNNKWGVIDSTGDAVIDPSYEEMIIIPNEKSDVFLCTYDVDYDTGTYKTKALNSKNEKIFENYEQIEAIPNHDEANNLWYEENVLRVQNNGKYGLIDLTGKKLLDCEYEEIVGLPGIKNTLRVLKEGKYGVVDNTGKVLVSPEFSEVKNLGKESKDGFIVKNQEGQYGIMSFLNQQVLEAKYEEITNVYGNQYYVVKQSGKPILIKEDGTEILTQGFDNITAILKNIDNGVIYQKGNQYGVINKEGQAVIEASYEELKEAKSGIFIAKKNGKYGIIDLSNTVQVEFQYKSLKYQEKADLYITEDEDFNNTILDSAYQTKQSGILLDIDEEKGYFAMRQGDETKYYNFKFEEKQENEIYPSKTLYLNKQGGKYGFVNQKGEVIVDYQYDDATNQNEYGYAGIKKDGKWGVINNKGEIIQNPIYELDEYLKIDFIGRWHLGKDLNMNYYNQL